MLAERRAGRLDGAQGRLERRQEPLRLRDLRGRQVEVVREEAWVGEGAGIDAGIACPLTRALVRQDREGQEDEQNGENESLGLQGHDASPLKWRDLPEFPPPDHPSRI